MSGLDSDDDDMEGVEEINVNNQFDNVTSNSSSLNVNEIEHAANTLINLKNKDNSLNDNANNSKKRPLEGDEKSSTEIDKKPKNNNNNNNNNNDGQGKSERSQSENENKYPKNYSERNHGPFKVFIQRSRKHSPGISRQKALAAIDVAKIVVPMLDSSLVKSIKSIGFNKVKVTCNTRVAANHLLNHPILKDNDLSPIIVYQSK